MGAHRSRRRARRGCRAATSSTSALDSEGHRRGIDVGGLLYAGRPVRPVAERSSPCASLASSSTSPRASSTRRSTTSIPRRSTGVEVGSCVLVDFANRPVVGYVVGARRRRASSSGSSRCARCSAARTSTTHGAAARRVDRRREYVCPLSEALRLFTPPGGTPRAVKVAGDGRRGVGAASAPASGPSTTAGRTRSPRARPTSRPSRRATMQRAVLDALARGTRPRRRARGRPRQRSTARSSGSSRLGVVRVERRRRMRDAHVREKAAPRHAALTDGQSEALAAIAERTGAPATGEVIVLDGVTGSGKTEVYLRAIERRARARATTRACSCPRSRSRRRRSGASARASATRSRCCTRGSSAGERFDQWDLVRRGEARIVVGARSALFAPLTRPRADRHRRGARVLLQAGFGAALPRARCRRAQIASLHRRDARARQREPVDGGAATAARPGEWTRVELPQRVTGRPLPPVTVVDMAAEFADGHRSMFSRPLVAALQRSRRARREGRAVPQPPWIRLVPAVPRVRLRARVRLVRDVADLPRGRRAARSAITAGRRSRCPPTCPRCGSPYLRQFGAGTQRVESELAQLLAGLPGRAHGRRHHARARAATSVRSREFEALDIGRAARHADDREGTRLPRGHARRRHQRRHDAAPAGLPSRRAHVPAARTGRRPSRARGAPGRGHRPDVLARSPGDPRGGRARPRALLRRGGGRSRASSATRRSDGSPTCSSGARSSAAWPTRAQALSPTLCGDACRTDWQLLGPSPAPLSRAQGRLALARARQGATRTPTSRDRSRRRSRRPSEPSGVSVAADVDPVDLL